VATWTYKHLFTCHWRLRHISPTPWTTLFELYVGQYGIREITLFFFRLSIWPRTESSYDFSYSCRISGSSWLLDATVCWLLLGVPTVGLDGGILVDYMIHRWYILDLFLCLFHILSLCDPSFVKTWMIKFLIKMILWIIWCRGSPFQKTDTHNTCSSTAT
jgi:hypothetical protein